MIDESGIVHEPKEDKVESMLDEAWNTMEGQMFRIIEIGWHGPKPKDAELVGAMANLITAEFFVRSARKRIAALPTE